MRVEVVAVQRVEAPGLRGFATEQLDHSHARDAFLEKRVDSREARANRAVRFTNPHAEHVRRDQDAGNHRERREREPPIDDQHRHADRKQREEVADPRYHTRGEQLVERLHVGRHSRDESAHRVAVEERDRKSLQVLEDLDAQIAHDALTKEARQHRLAQREDELKDESRSKERCAQHHQSRIASRYCDVDDTLRQCRTHQLERPVRDEEPERSEHERSVRPRVAKQPPHQAAVVRFP